MFDMLPVSKLPWSERGGRVPTQEERDEVRERLEVLMNKEDVLEKAWEYCALKRNEMTQDDLGSLDAWPEDFIDWREVFFRALQNLQHIQAEHRGQYAKQDEEFQKNILNTVALEAAKELVRRIS